ncbi:hypothetical protein FB451DRAFT_269696 [Mycena latifolia]|nr:hypothetical protein FB451DRAFT_269696 [Mycena latifolia]
MAQDPRRVRIAEIDREIAKLQTERQTLVESLIFPVLTLPVEITSQIFVECLPPTPPSASTFDAPLVLGRVCSRWREIALSTPQLWASWSLAIDGGSLSRVIYSLKLWLERSKNCPLSIRLHHKDCTSEDVNSDDEDWWERSADFGGEITPILGQHYRQWESMEFNMPLSCLRGLSSFVPNGGLPFLRHLTLGSSQEDWAGTSSFHPVPLTLFAEAPRLTSVHLILEDNHFPLMEQVHIPYAQLTSFTGTAFSLSECLTLLAQTPALVDCVFYLETHDNLSPFGLSIQPLLHLKTLKLWSSVAYAYLILGLVTLPSLETLSIACHPGSSSATRYVVDSFFSRSGCNLRSLSFSSGLLEVFSAVLQDNSSMLSTLELLDYPQQDAFQLLRYLQQIMESDGVPHLEDFTIYLKTEGNEGDFLSASCLPS